MMDTETIYVYLPEEATDCWYPTRAESLDADSYRLMDPSTKTPSWSLGRVILSVVVCGS